MKEAEKESLVYESVESHAMDPMQIATLVKPGLPLHAKRESGITSGASGKPVGTVDHLDGEKYVKLRKSDAPGGAHRWIPIDWIENIDASGVHLNKTEAEFAVGVSEESPEDSKAGSQI